MKKNKKTTKAAQKPAERPKLTDARDKTRGAKGGGKTEGAREAQSEAGVRCSALLGDGSTIRRSSMEIEEAKEELLRLVQRLVRSSDFRLSCSSKGKYTFEVVGEVAEEFLPVFHRYLPKAMKKMSVRKPHSRHLILRWRD